MHLTFILLKSPNLKILGYPVLHNSVNKLEKQWKHSYIASNVINLYSCFKNWLVFSPKVEEISRYVDKL
jgi:hypothetical protein